MLFNSLDFFIFFPAVVVLYFILPLRFRWVLLLAASYFFYMKWKPIYVLLIVASTLVDYLAAQQMSRHVEKKKRKPWLYLSLASNLGILLTFKYYNFFQENINELLIGADGSGYQLPIAEWLLPMGISFYTFQTMAYSIDVYNSKIKAEKHLGYFALYVTYFPQLVAGPIERAQNLLPEFRKKYDVAYPRIVSGLKQMLWGLFKKVVIADNIGTLVDIVYNQPDVYSGAAVIVATVLFAFQIYADFSGYSDIAIGASRVLGIDLMVNFRTPYLATSIRDFWARWHISLSTWFRDYLYIPLGGNRVIKWRWYMNLLVVFLVSGFWHGANWTFIIWGGLHGAYLVLAILFEPFWKKAVPEQMQKSFFYKLGNIAITFVLVVFAWLFFRANTIDDAMHFLSGITDWNMEGLIAYGTEVGSGTVLTIGIVLTGFVLIDPVMDKIVKGELQLPKHWAYPIFALILVGILLVGNFGEVNFIYFQF